MKNTTNVFSSGMVKDMHPLTTSQQSYTDALNATLITFNGNEMMMQNDMGNTKILDSKTGNIMGLREGFIPVGMKEHGGVMYIASVNKDGEGEIGTIPSPVIEFNKKGDYSVNKDNPDKLFEFTIESGFNESLLYLITDQQLSVGEKFTVALDFVDTTVEKSITNGSDLVYPLISLVEDESEGSTFNNSYTSSKGRYKVKLYSKTLDLIYDISYLTEKKYGYSLIGDSNPDNDWWFFDLKDDAAKPVFDLDSMLIADQAEDKGEAFIKYPNIPPGYLCISLEKEKLDSVLLSPNSTTGYIHPVTYLTLNSGKKSYLIGFPELWYKTNSAIHIDKFTVKVLDKNNNKVYITSYLEDEVGQQYGSGYDFTFNTNDGIKRYYLDGIYKLLIDPVAEGPKEYVSKTDSVPSLEERNEFKYDVLFFIDNIEDLNLWFTLHVDCYDNAFTDPVYLYELKFNQYLMGEKKLFLQTNLISESNYPAKQTNEVSLKYDKNKNENNIQIQTDITKHSIISKGVGFNSMEYSDEVFDLSLIPEISNSTASYNYLYESPINLKFSRKINYTDNAEEKLIRISDSFSNISYISEYVVLLATINYRLNEKSFSKKLVIGTTDILQHLPLSIRSEIALFLVTEVHVPLLNMRKVGNDYIILVGMDHFKLILQSIPNATTSDIPYDENLKLNISNFNIYFNKAVLKIGIKDGIEQIDNYTTCDELFIDENIKYDFEVKNSLKSIIPDSETDLFNNISNYKIIPLYNLICKDINDSLDQPTMYGYTGINNSYILSKCNIKIDKNYLMNSDGLDLEYIYGTLSHDSYNGSSLMIQDLIQYTKVANKEQNYNIAIPRGVYYLSVNFAWNGLLNFEFSDTLNSKLYLISLDHEKNSIIFSTPTSIVLSKIYDTIIDGESNIAFHNMGLYEIDLTLDTELSKSATQLLNNDEFKTFINTDNLYAVPQVVYCYLEDDIKCLEKTYSFNTSGTFAVNAYQLPFGTYTWDKNLNSTNAEVILPTGLTLKITFRTLNSN